MNWGSAWDSITKTHRVVSCCKISRRTTHREIDLVVHGPVNWEVERATQRPRLKGHAPCTRQELPMKRTGRQIKSTRINQHVASYMPSTRQYGSRDAFIYLGGPKSSPALGSAHRNRCPVQHGQTLGTNISCKSERGYEKMFLPVSK